MKRRLLSLALAIAALGCSEKGPDLARVSGKVLYKDRPVEGAAVVFIPANGPPAIGTTDAEGSFTLTTREQGDGATVGEHKVTVSKSAPPNGMTEQEYQEKARSAVAGADLPPRTALLPEKYANTFFTPLTVTINPGENKDLVLELQD